MKISVKFNGSFRRLIKAVNVALGILSIFLIVGLGCSYFDKKIPVPNFVSDAISSALAKQGMSVEFSSIYMGLDLSIVLNDVRLRVHGTSNDFFRAEKVCAGLRPIYLFYKKIPIRYVSVVGAEALQCFGDNKTGIKNIDFMLRFGLENYRLDLFKFNVHNLKFSATGEVENDFEIDDIEEIVVLIGGQIPESKNKKQADSLTLMKVIKQYDAVLASVVGAKSYFQMVETPSIDLNFRFLRGGKNFINLDLITPSAKLEIAKEEYSFENLKVLFQYANSDARKQIKVFANVNELRTSLQKFSVSNISARTGLSVNSKDIVLNDVDLSARKLEFDGTVIENIFIGKENLSSTSFKDGWKIFLSRDKTSFAAMVSITDDNTIKCNFSGDLALEPIFERKELADIPELKDFDFPHGINLSGNVSYKIGEAFPELDAHIEVSDSVIMCLDIDTLSADVAMKDGVLYCTNINAKSKEGWGASGNFIQNLKNNAYDIEVKGNLRPMAIAHFMEDWWTKVMGAFTFVDEKRLPFADVRVEGVWGAPENIWCYGFVSGQDALYNGSKFDKFSLYVWVNPTRITLYDVAISTENGARKGECFIEWLYDDAGGLDSYDKQRLFLRSNLNSAELIALGGEDAKEVLDVVIFENPPELTLSALLFNSSNNPKKLNDIFNAQIRATGGVSVEMIRLENATFSARSDKINTEIYDAKFTFCGGDATGNVNLKRAKSTMFADGSASVSKMNQGEFFKFLSSLGTSNSSENTQNNSAEKMLGGDANGEVTATLALKGDVKNMSQAQGRGEVLIDSKDFLKLNLFGGISKAFSSIGVPVGAFDISNVSANYELSGGELRLSPVEMTGPALRIVGAAAYVLETDAVRGELKAYPFDKVDNQIMSAVNRIVNPIMDTVRVTVGGTLSDPEFWAKITPVDVIRSEKKTIERIDKSL